MRRTMRHPSLGGCSAHTVASLRVANGEASSLTTPASLPACLPPSFPLSRNPSRVSAAFALATLVRANAALMPSWAVRGSHRHACMLYGVGWSVPFSLGCVRACVPAPIACGMLRVWCCTH